MVRINSPILGCTQMGMVHSSLTMEQQMLLRTLRDKQRPMSAFELTNHWMPTWSLQEVNNFMHDLVKSGYVRTEGRHVKFYSVSMTAISEKVGSQ